MLFCNNCNMQEKHFDKPEGQGVRQLKLVDIAPKCEVFVNEEVYSLSDISRGKKVADIGCGYGKKRKIVESAGGEWVGVEPFDGGAHTVVGDAENLPFENESFDVVLMDAVLEHIPNVSNAFSEVSRILRKDGLFVGYVAYMECFHEISYSHLSFKAMEHFSAINKMKLEKISGGSRFGIDYHLRVLFYPVNINFIRGFIASCIRGLIFIKSKFAYVGLRFGRNMKSGEAHTASILYYKIECLRQSVGFNFVIRKL